MSAPTVAGHLSAPIAVAKVADEAPAVVCLSVRCGHPLTRRRCGHLDCVHAGDADRCGACHVPPPRVRMAFALLAMLLLLATSPARADRGLELAQAATHEAGFDVQPEEVAAIWAVTQVRCNGSMRCQMPRFFAGRTSRPWALWLRRDGSRPWGWPAASSWQRYAARWREVLETADAVVSGELGHSCNEQPEAWGMPHGVDMERARRMRLVAVDCGETANRYWRFPR